MIKFKKFISVLVALAVAATVVAPSSSFASTVTSTRYEVRSKDYTNFEGGGGSIDLGAFYNRFGRTPLSGQGGRYNGPRGMYVVRDVAVNTNRGPHGGSYWKLFNRSGRQIGTYDKYGAYLRP